MAAKPIVFLAEDNAGDINLLRLALSKHRVDCELVVFGDGASALIAIARAETGLDAVPGLFIIDLNLPKMDGLTLLRHLRASDTFHQTPVVMWTTSDSASDRAQSERLGASRHLCKPGDLRSFMDLGLMVQNILHGSAVSAH
jgi:DNA-binding response OmpR family regulator